MNENPRISDDMIRRQYDEKTRSWQFSVIDVIAIVSESTDPRNYWKVLKSRLQKANPQLVTACNQLKLPSSDGKSYLTDVATSETLLEIITTISIPQVAPFRLWFEKIESSIDLQNSFPQIESSTETVDLPIDVYQRNGVLFIEALVAGTNPEDIIIRTTYESITISGSRKVPGVFSKQDTVIQELFYGNFSRSLDFPLPVELDKIEAFISHGFLNITIPLVDLKRTRIIKIKPQ
jgi:HSP20 family molecular chaperone IbpA